MDREEHERSLVAHWLIFLKGGKTQSVRVINRLSGLKSVPQIVTPANIIVTIKRKVLYSF